MRKLFAEALNGHGPVETGHLFLTRAGMISRITPHPGQRDALRERLLALAAAAVAAPGCYLYLIHDAADDSEDIWLVEAWRSLAQQSAWHAQPEVHELMTQTDALIAGCSEPIFTVPVGGKGMSVRWAS